MIQDTSQEHFYDEIRTWAHSEGLKIVQMCVMNMAFNVDNHTWTCERCGNIQGNKSVMKNE